jgi:kynurenine formamidase
MNSLQEDRVSVIKQNRIIDLTKPLDKSIIPYTSGRYSDPPLEITEWSSIDKEGFRVSRLSLGTQTGTHIDAPAHFLEGSATLDVLPADDLIGNYFLLDLPRSPSPAHLAEKLKAYNREKVILIRTPENVTANLPEDSLRQILSLPPLLLVLSGEIEMDHSAPFAFHRLVACAGKFLVEDLDQRKAHLVCGKGEIFIFPLKLVGAGGSPCRVVVRMEE